MIAAPDCVHEIRTPKECPYYFKFTSKVLFEMYQLGYDNK